MNTTTHSVRFEVVRGDDLVTVIVTGQVDPMSVHIASAETVDGKAVELTFAEADTACELLVEADDDAQISRDDFMAGIYEDEAMARADLECCRG